MSSLSRFLQSRRRQARAIRACEAGAVAVIVALMMPVLVGAMGLGAETGYWYVTQRSLQNSADAAVHGAAKLMANGGDDAAMQQIADYLAERAARVDPADVLVNQPPEAGVFAGRADAVEAVVGRTLPRAFSAIYGGDPVVLSARAVALVQEASQGCVLALSRTAQGAISVTGSSDSALSLCDMISNAEGEAFVMSGNGASVSAQCIQTVGTAVTTANLSVECDQLRENADVLGDPFAHLPEPDMTGLPCQSGSVGANNATTSVTAEYPYDSDMNAALFCDGLRLRGTVHFGPGIYMITGGSFEINSNANITGDGVMFYLAPGVDLKFNGSAMIDLSAPTAGTYAGVLFFGSRDSVGVTHSINGNFGSILDGAIYAPKSHLDVSGSARTSATGCTQLVTDTVTFSGGGNIDINCAHPSGPTIDVPGRVSLVE